MAKRKIFSFTCWLLVTFLCLCSTGWYETVSAGEFEEKLGRAEEAYSKENYSTAKDIFTSLYQSFPTDARHSYLQFMIAKCDYHLENYAFARDKFRRFTKEFPRSRFKPACYFMLGNIAYLQGANFESAQNFVYAYQSARNDKVKRLARQSLEPLLEKWVSIKDLERLSTTVTEEELVSRIFFHLGKRNFEKENYAEALRALSYYRDNFPDGESIQDVYLLLGEISTSPSKTVRVGVLAPLSGDLSVYGTSLLNGINLALSSNPSSRRKIELRVGDTEGDFVKAALICERLIREDSVVCIIGPLRSESVAAAAMAVRYSGIPLITPTASKKGLASLGDFVFQLSPSPQTKARKLAEFVVNHQGFEDFIILSPEGEQLDSEASAFKKTAEDLGGEIVAEAHYPFGTQDFSPYLTRIRNRLLDIPSELLQQEEESFFDEIPVWADGLFISADHGEMYDILSHIARLNIYATIIGTEAFGDREVLEFVQNIGREAIFSSEAFPEEENPRWQHLSQLYHNEHGKDPDRVSLLGYDSMLLLLSIFESVVSPTNIKEALLRTNDFEGTSGKVSFDSQGENIDVSVYTLELGTVRKVR